MYMYVYTLGAAKHVFNCVMNNGPMNRLMPFIETILYNSRRHALIQPSLNTIHSPEVSMYNGGGVVARSSAGQPVHQSIHGGDGVGFARLVLS